MQEPVDASAEKPVNAKPWIILHWRSWVQALIVILAVLAVYWPALTGEFVWDDLVLVDRNPLLTRELSLRTIWFHTDFPLTLVAFWTQSLLWGSRAVGFHAVNIALHAINALLLWAVLSRLKIRGAWLAALIFAVHPVCAASAAW